MNIKVNPEFLKENNKEQLDKYQCPRCRYLLKDAVQTSCGHWLCNDCAVNLFEANSTPNCPREDCGETLTNEDGRPFFPDRFVRKEISKFNMICLNAKHGCPWSGQIGQLSDHLSMCQYDKQDCPHCQESFNSSELKKHIEVCPKAMTFCPLRDYGCDHQHEMTRKDCMDHVTSPGVMMTHLMLLISMITKLLPRSDSSILDRVESDGPNNSSSYNETPVQFRNATGRTTQLDSGGASAAAVQRKFPFVDPGFGSFGYNFDLLLNSLSSLPNSQKLMPLFVSVKQEIDVIRSQLTKKDNLVQQLQDKVQQLEATVLAKNAENEDRDFRLSLMENSNYDGTMVWKIPQFSQRREDARSGKYTSIFSLPFYSGRYGYKMCLRLYILGDGIGKGTHMSLFFVVMKGEFDNILQWPFTHKVTFKLINQCGGRDIVDIFQPDPMSTSFQKPKTDMNVASGCPRFVSSNELMQGGFIVDDTIFIKVKVDSKLSSPKEVEEYNSVQCSDHSTDYSLVPVQPASLKQATCTDFVAGNYSLLLKKLKDSFIYVNHQEMNMTLSKSSCSECTMKHSKIDKTKNIIYETLKTSNGDHPWFHVASKPSGFRWNVNIDELLENGQVESPFFYSKFAEYKMVAGLRVFEKDKVTLVEVYFAIVQGEFDDCIEWPFSHTVVVKIVGQDGYQSVVQSDIQLNSRAFEKPLSDRNISCCCPNFLSFDELMGFAIKETVFFEIEVK